MVNVSINSCKSCQSVLKQDTFYAISTLTFQLVWTIKVQAVLSPSMYDVMTAFLLLLCIVWWLTLPRPINVSKRISITAYFIMEFRSHLAYMQGYYFHISLLLFVQIKEWLSILISKNRWKQLKSTRLNWVNVRLYIIKRLWFTIFLEGPWLQHNQQLFCVVSTVFILSCPCHKPISFIVTYCEQCPAGNRTSFDAWEYKIWVKINWKICIYEEKLKTITLTQSTSNMWVVVVASYNLLCASLCLCIREDAMPNSIVKYCRWMLPCLILHDSRCFLSGFMVNSAFSRNNPSGSTHFSKMSACIIRLPIICAVFFFHQNTPRGW